jgi:hypothetical protein
MAPLSLSSARPPATKAALTYADRKSAALDSLLGRRSQAWADLVPSSLS